MKVHEQVVPRLSDPAPGTPGRMFVDLIACVERCMHAAARKYPAVDHLAPHPGAPTVAEIDTLDRQVVEWAAPAVQAAFARWRQASRDFDAAVRDLEQLHTDSHERQPDFQRRLEERMHALRETRVALARAGEALRERVATELDAGFLRGHA